MCPSARHLILVLPSIISPLPALGASAWRRQAQANHPQEEEGDEEAPPEQVG